MDLADRISAALNESPADLLIRNARVVNTLSGEIHPADVAVKDGIILGFGHYEAGHVLDADGRYLCPGLIDGHMHVESTLLSPSQFARAAAVRGTCAVVADPHEIANVLGVAGVEYMLRASQKLPVDFFFMMPSCVPATHLETAGAVISSMDVQRALAEHPGRILGLAEVMNVPGVLGRDPEMLAKIRAAAGRRIDGHAPGLAGLELNAYILAGPGSDHECTEADQALDKLRRGLFLMLREGTSERNLESLAPLASRCDTTRMGLVTDDRHPTDLMRFGHMDHCVRRAIALGIPPVKAVQMASLNTARHFGLARRGALAPGFRADFLLLDDLERFEISDVYLAGQRLSELHWPDQAVTPTANTMHAGTIANRDFLVPAEDADLRVIGVIPGQIVTESLTMPPLIENGHAQADPERDLAKLAVIERHQGTGNIGLGFVRGLGLRTGAVASTVAHDSHNLIVAGANDADMALAARQASDMGGGLVVVSDGRVLATLPLPIAGLMSDQPLEKVVDGLDTLNTALGRLGPTADHLFMVLSFLALPVIPALKLTDKGLVDVTAFERVSLWKNS